MIAILLRVLPLVYPPLTADQVVRLETAVDGRDHQEEAFVALCENAHAYRDALGPSDEPVRLVVDRAALLADPDSARGALVRLEGVVHEPRRLAPPFEDVIECFLVDASDVPHLVYFVDARDDPLELDHLSEWSCIARFYKRVDATARDGTDRAYAAFVGARPMRRDGIGAGTETGQNRSVTWTPFVIVLVGAVTLVFLLRASRRAAARLPHVLTSAGPEDDAGDRIEEDLPDDPASALAELRRRSQREDES